MFSEESPGAISTEVNGDMYMSSQYIVTSEQKYISCCIIIIMMCEGKSKTLFFAICQYPQLKFSSIFEEHL